MWRRRRRLRWRLRLVVATPHVAPPPTLVLSALRRLLSAHASPPVCLLFASWLSRHPCCRAAADFASRRAASASRHVTASSLAVSLPVADVQTSLPSMRRRLRRHRDCDCRPRRLLPSSLVVELVSSSTSTYVVIVVVVVSRRAVAVAVVVDFAARRACNRRRCSHTSRLCHHRRCRRPSRRRHHH